LRLREQALIVGELALVLGLQELVGARIDLCQEVALLDQLAFGESDLEQLAVDLGLHGDGGDRRDRAERVDDDANIALADRGGAHRLRRGLRHGSLGGAGRLGGILRAVGPVTAGREPDQDDQPDDELRSSRLTLDDRLSGERPPKAWRGVLIGGARSLVHRRSIPQGI